MVWNIIIIVIGLAWLGVSALLKNTYMLVAFVPVIMFISGYIAFEKIAWKEKPKDNSWQYVISPGYATGASMRSQETWRFANQHCGNWYMRGSVPLLVISELILYFFQHYAYTADLIVLGQMIFVLMPFFLTEHAINKTFDRQGNRYESL